MNRADIFLNDFKVIVPVISVPILLSRFRTGSIVTKLWIPMKRGFVKKIERGNPPFVVETSRVA